MSNPSLHREAGQCASASADSSHGDVPASGGGISDYDTVRALRIWGQHELADQFTWVLMNVEQS